MASAVSRTPRPLCRNTCSSTGYALVGWGGELRAPERFSFSPLHSLMLREESSRPQPAPNSCPFPISFAVTLQVGEDVPDARKCACASHVAKVAEFFQVRVGSGLVGVGDRHGDWLPEPAFVLRQGVDVIVNASSVEDIDAGAIGQRLSNGLARLSSPVLHRLRLREDENAEPVVSVHLWWAGPAWRSTGQSPLGPQCFVGGGRGVLPSTWPVGCTHTRPLELCRAPPIRRLMPLWR